MKKIFILFIFIAFSINSYSQNSGNEVFNNDILHEVRFNFDQSDYWDQMINNFEFNMDDVPYIIGAVTIDSQLVDSVGVRFKGFTSYTFESDKKPIKIDFNEFVPGKRMDGLRKLNLNNATGDPSMQRDVICYDLMRKMGVKAPRTSYARVYFNDQYWGLYQLIEQIDKEFLQNNFTNDDGNLFKNLGWSHFEWLGPNDANYHPPFSLKTNKDEADWSGFVNLMDVLNNGSDAEIETAFSEIFNIDLFLKVLAIDVATNNWDAYIEHGRNWYIYEDIVTDQFHWIPWDYNFSLGGGNFQSMDEECEIYADFATITDATTTVEFFESAYYNETVTFKWNFGDGNVSTLENPIHVYNTPGMYNVCLEVKHDDMCVDELCLMVDTDFNLEDCPVQQDGSCPHPVDEAFALTLNIIPECCGDWNGDCEDFHNWFSGEEGGFGASDFTIDQRENEGVLIQRLLNNPAINERYYTLFCDLLKNVMIEDPIFDLIEHNRILIDTSVAQDPNFLFDYNTFVEEITSLEEGGIKNIIAERITALSAELDTIYTCPEENTMITVGDLVINEFMASSDMESGILDTDGEYDDWIELYNTSNETLNLSGVYLSDDPSIPLKWVLPYGTKLSPDSYLIIWADQDSIQFGLHANFKLTKAGGSILLSNADGTILDDVTYLEQTTNLAYARNPNGEGPFVIQSHTHGFNNDQFSSTKNTSTIEGKIFPNPASTVINIELEDATSSMKIKLFTADGKRVMETELLGNNTSFDISDLNNGLYHLQIVTINGGQLSHSIVVMR